MIKRTCFFIIVLCLSIVLAACTNEDVAYEAKASDFEGEGFERNSQRVVVLGDELVIFAVYNNPNAKKKTSIDKLLEAEGSVSGEFHEKRYKNVEIQTEKDMYYITADGGISLAFQKVGERIVADEEGMEYFTGKYSEE